MEIDNKIGKFIGKHHVMTIATLEENGCPQTANLFYAYNSEDGCFIFTSSLSTAHGANMEREGRVAANIVLETSVVGCIEGLQIKGVATRPKDKELVEAKKLYIKRFPYAIVADLEIWVLRADFFKLTDNKLGFGKKIIWERV